MAAAKKKNISRWYDGSTPLEELDASEQMAHAIVLQHADLAPSVTRIMDADLEPDQRVVAMASFRDALESPGDPHRDPRVAIANAAK